MEAIIRFYKVAIENLQSFGGTGLMFELMLVSLFFLAFYLKDSNKKHMLTWFPMGVLIIYFIPLWTFFVILRDDSEVLYRIIWLVPMGIIVCYALVEVIMLSKSSMKPAVFIGMILLIIISGEYTYGSKQYRRAENIYHVPDAVVHICDEIEVPGREIRACFPEELISSVRQYSSTVFLTYGRGSLIVNYRQESEIQNLLREDIIDTETLVKGLRETNTPYLVISEEKNFNNSLWDYNFAYVTTIDGYDIYLDNEAYIGLDINMR